MNASKSLGTTESGNGLPEVFCIAGPTCSGKTELAVAISEELECEVISVDSAMVYKHMNIGTAKPGQSILSRTPHRLIDVCDPAQTYSAHQFRRDALTHIEEIFSQGKTPLLVGGTMLYFSALEKGLAALPSANPAIRLRLENEVKKYGLSKLHEYLCEVDSDSGKRIHPKDSQRIFRAIEIFLITGKKMSDLLSMPNGVNGPANFFKMKKIIVSPNNRIKHHENIELRFRQMLDEGFLAEVEGLFARKDLSADLPSMRAVGYRQLWSHLSGEYGYDLAVEKGIIATRQLAKRQLTWMRKEKNTTWFDAQCPNLSADVSAFFRS